MKITKVDVKLVNNEKPQMKGRAYIEIDDCFAIENVRIIEKSDGTLFAAMPSKKCSDGQHRDTCHPINEETRKMFNEVVIAEYNRVKNEAVEEEA